MLQSHLDRQERLHWRLYEIVGGDNPQFFYPGRYRSRAYQERFEFPHYMLVSNAFRPEKHRTNKRFRYAKPIR